MASDLNGNDGVALEINGSIVATVFIPLDRELEKLLLCLFYVRHAGRLFNYCLESVHRSFRPRPLYYHGKGWGMVWMFQMY